MPATNARPMFWLRINQGYPRNILKFVTAEASGYQTQVSIVFCIIFLRYLPAKFYFQCFVCFLSGFKILDPRKLVQSSYIIGVYTIGARNMDCIYINYINDFVPFY